MRIAPTIEKRANEKIAPAGERRANEKIADAIERRANEKIADAIGRRADKFVTRRNTCAERHAHARLNSPNANAAATRFTLVAILGIRILDFNFS